MNDTEASARDTQASCGLCGHKEVLHIRAIQIGSSDSYNSRIDDACANAWTLTADGETWVQGEKSCACGGFQEQAVIEKSPAPSSKSDWGICAMRKCDQPAHPNHTYESTVVHEEGKKIKIRAYMCPSHGQRCAVALRTHDPVKWKPEFHPKRIRAWDEVTGAPVKITDIVEDK